MQGWPRYERITIDAGARPVSRPAPRGHSLHLVGLVVVTTGVCVFDLVQLATLLLD